MGTARWQESEHTVPSDDRVVVVLCPNVGVTTAHWVEENSSWQICNLEGVPTSPHVSATRSYFRYWVDLPQGVNR